MKPKDQTNAKHHFLPKMYLEGFAENGKVGVWQRSDGAVRNNAPASVASIKGFYTFTNEDGVKSDELEKAFANIEGKVQRIISHINTLFPPLIVGETKHILAEYLALQHARLPVTRKQQEETFDLISKMHMRIGISSREEIIQKLTDAGHEVTDEAIAQIEDFRDNPHELQIVPSKEEVLKIQMQGIPLIAQMLFHREWNVLTFDSPCLITSDSPLLLRPNYEEPYYWLRGTGFATASEIWFPLSSTRLLVLTPQRYRKVTAVPGRADIAALANDLQLQSSYLEAFGPPSIIGQFEGKGLGVRALGGVEAGFDKDFFDHYNQPPVRPRPINK